MAAKLFRTSDMELTLYNAALKHEHVVVRRAYFNEAKTYIRLNDVPGHEKFFRRPWNRNYKTQIDAWRETGGILIDDDPSRPVLYTDVGPHHVHFFTECPHALYDLDALAREASEEKIVYVPKTWDGHLKYIDEAFPPSDKLRTGLEYIKSRMLSDYDFWWESYLIVNGYEFRNPVAFLTDAEVMAATGFSPDGRAALARFFYKYAPYQYRWAFYEITLNVRPDNPAMAAETELYDFLEERRIEGFARMLISQKHLYGWGKGYKRPMRELARRGCITRHAKYRPYTTTPHNRYNFEIVDRKRRTAFTEFMELKKAVARAPEYKNRYPNKLKKEKPSWFSSEFYWHERYTRRLQRLAGDDVD